MINKTLITVFNVHLILLALCCYGSSKPYSTKIGTILFENYHSHFRAIISATRSFLDLHLSLNKITIDDSHVIFLKTGNIHDVVKAVNHLKSENVSLIIGPPENDFGDFVQLFCTEQRILYLSYYFDPQGGISPYIYRLFPKIDDETDNINKFIESGIEMRNICNIEECWRYTNKAILELSAKHSYRFLEASLMLGLINSQNWFYLFSLDNTEHGMESFSHNTMRLSVAGQFDEHMLNNNGTYKPLIKAYKQKLEKDRINKTDITDLVRFHDALLSIPIILPKISQKLSLQKKVIFGLTGKIIFDEQRMRADAAFHVLEMGVDGNQINTGLWYTNSKQLERVLSMTDKTLANTHESMMEETKTQRLLRVVSIEEKPYVMRKTLPNGRIIYEGFCIDLLNRLAHDLNFEYKLTIVPDGKYGEPINGTKDWDGLIGEILKGEATAAVAPITVTAGRLEVVDFTDPFLQLGISMLMKIPDDDNKASSSFLSFLLPLSPSVWMYWAFITVFSVLAVTTIAILSPHESAGQFNATNSIWYLICILLRAGSGYNCRSVSNRIVSAAWWAFTLILIAQYTANFAAVLTIDRKSLPFNSFEELGNQTEYEFGTIQGGSTMHFFMYSRLDTFRRIWLRMQNMSKSVFVYGNQQGVQKVLAEKYVFLMESASLEYQLTLHCNLTKVGNVVLGSNGYSIALPKGSKWRERLSRQILDYNEKGIMMMLKRTWWKKTPQIEECEEQAVETRKSLGMEKVSGIFGLLAIGLFASFVVVIAERMVTTNVSKDKQFVVK
uniref:Uncharacterized protein n=1 Tax=Panagrolaimus superbus TaxID=310955 RepID=A0A914YWZ5_9BILA